MEAARLKMRIPASIMGSRGRKASGMIQMASIVPAKKSVKIPTKIQLTKVPIPMYLRP